MKNITAISYMRVVAMIFIVVYHSLCCYTGLWGMKECIIPLYEQFYLIFSFVGLHSFVFISGFLYAHLTYKAGRYQNNFSFLVTKAKRLLIPYCIWGIFMWIVFHQTIYDFLAGTTHLWFLLMLFAVFFIITITKKVWYNTSKVVDGILLFAVLLIWYVKDMVLGASISGTGNKAIIYLPVFFLGMLMAKYNLLEKLRKIHYAVFLNNIALLVLLIILAFVNQKLYTTGFLNLYCYFIPPLLLIMFDSLFSKKSVPNVIKSLDKSSMGIYILHQICISFFLLLSSVQFLDTLHYWGPLSIFGVSFSVSWGITAFINRYKKIATYLFG